MNREIQQLYPNFIITIEEDESTYIRFQDENILKQVQGELHTIRYFLHRKYDPLTMKNSEGIINEYDPPRFSELLVPIIYEPDYRSNNAILHDILLIDPYFDLSGELKRVIRLNNLRESLSYSIWNQLYNLPWAIYPSENKIDLYVESNIPIEFPDYVNVDKRIGTSRDLHSEYYITSKDPSIPLSRIADIIILNALDDPYNTTFEVHHIFPLN